MTSELLTEAERHLIEKLETCWDDFHEIVGNGSSRETDLKEFTYQIHALQRVIMSQAAGRAYPDEFRLLGEAP